MKLIFYTIAVIITTIFLFQHLHGVEQDYTSQLQTDGTQQYFSHVYKNFLLINTNENGNVQSEMSSPLTNYTVSEQKTVMDKPNMIMHRDNEPPIVITANTADVLHDKNITVLQENVIVNMPDKSNNPVKLTTEELIVNNISQTATTDKPASISHGKGNMHGTGLEFNPHNKQIKFLSKVRGSYEY